MANIIIRTIEIKNISRQNITVSIKKQTGSLIFTKFGSITLVPEVKLEAEDDRYDLAQIRQLQNKKLITLSKFRRSIVIIPITTSIATDEITATTDEVTASEDSTEAPPIPPIVTTKIIAAGYNRLHYLRATDGQLFSWGSNSAGGLGNQSILAQSSPVSVVGGHSFRQAVGADSFTGAIKADGSTWTWGEGSDGRLGNNTETSRSSPISVIGGHLFSQAAGTKCIVAIKGDGTAWAWGSNIDHQLGDNTGSSQSSPVSVVGDHSFIQVTCFYDASFGLKADGSVWSWGRNNFGILGTDDLHDTRSSPVSVVGDHSFTYIKTGNGGRHIIALKADGSAWAWGGGQDGTIGDDTEFDRSSPVSVVGDHSFIKVATGGVESNSDGFSLGLKQDGSVWAWGSSNFGKLGNNEDADYRSSPVSVVGNHSFIDIDAFGPQSIALKADNSVWTWGQNTSGALGDNTIQDRSSPVSVVGLP